MNLLLTCAGRRNYIVDYFKAVLAPMGGRVYAANSTKDSTALIAADKGFILPGLIEPQYLDTLIATCKKYDVSAVIPLFDPELPVLAAAKERLAEEGIDAVVSSSGVVDVCNDKWKTAMFLQEHGFRVPRTSLCIDHALTEISAKSLRFPLIVKPRWAMGSIGVFEADNEEELRLFYRKITNIVDQSHILARQSNREANVIIQEKIVGIEYGLDVVNNLNGEYIVTFVKRKLAMRYGETDGATVERNACLGAVGEALGSCLRHVANLDADLIVRGDDVYVLELNPRFGGHYPFSQLAGANVPAAIVAWLTGKEPDVAWFQVRDNVTGYKGLTIMEQRAELIDMTAARAC